MRWRLGGALLIAWVAAQEADSLPTHEAPPVEIRAHSPVIPPSHEGIGQRIQMTGLTNLVYRSVPFAQEVVYQGLLPQQTQVTIDGMRVVPACVDRMDPVLTFVEQAAWEGAAWSATQSWGATPTLNLSLLSPGTTADNYLTLQTADNYHRFVGALRLGGSRKRWHYAAAFTTRLGGPYRSGQWYSFPLPENTPTYGRDSSWNLPTFQKYNLYLALRYDLAEAHQIEIRYLSDVFYDVAYPALIMDARHSTFHLPSLSYSWKNRLSLRLYANTIFHDMTDETRPQTEIRTRIVMPGMYMPMKGLTRSLGAVAEVSYLQASRWKLTQHSEYSQHFARATMDMYLINSPTNRMQLYNLADIRFQQTTHRLTLTFAGTHTELQTYAAGSYFTYKVQDTLSFAPLRLYQENYAGKSQANRQFFTYQVGTEGTFRMTPDLKAAATLSYGTRPPTHTELYAYYLYVPQDNSIQMGNSTLRPENLLHTELRLIYQRAPWGLEGTAYLNYLRDYITPVTFLQPFSAGNGTAQFWRILQNSGRAYTTGGQMLITYEQERLTLRLLGGYTYGWHVDYREPLPWIYPLHGRLQVGIPYRRHRLVSEIYAAATQKHLSRTIYPEDVTPGYWLLHLRYNYTLPFPRHAINSRLTLQVSVENLLNAYGWDHLSVGNMPFLGRVVSGGVYYSW